MLFHTYHLTKIGTNSFWPFDLRLWCQQDGDLWQPKALTGGPRLETRPKLHRYQGQTRSRVFFPSVDSTCSHVPCDYDLSCAVLSALNVNLWTADMWCFMAECVTCRSWGFSLPSCCSRAGSRARFCWMACLMCRNWGWVRKNASGLSPSDEQM